MERLKALMIAPMRPARSGNGLAMRICLFVEAIERFADLDVVIVPVAGEPLAPAPLFRVTTRFHIASVRASLALSLMSRMAPSERLRAFAAIGRPSMSELLSAEAEEIVARITSRSVFDFVLVSRAYMLPLIDAIPDRAPILVDLDEDDHASTCTRATIASEQGDRAAADWMMLEAAALDRLVGVYRPKVATFFLSSKNDYLSIRRRHAGLRAQVVVNAVVVPNVIPRRHNGRTIVFVGAFGYLPNVDGVGWFVNTVVPRLKAIDPRGFDLILAGAHPPRSILNRAHHPRLMIRQDFHSVSPLYAQATVAIAPMRAGGGGRTKIIEAAAHGVACVAHEASANSTLAGAGWIAGNAFEFASACAEALNPETSPAEPRGRQSGRRGPVCCRSRPRRAQRRWDLLRPANATLAMEHRRFPWAKAPLPVSGGTA